MGDTNITEADATAILESISQGADLRAFSMEVFIAPGME
jgi:hypothetical protein